MRYRNILMAAAIGVMVASCGGGVQKQQSNDAVAEAVVDTATVDKEVRQQLEKVYEAAGKVFDFDTADDLLQEYRDHLDAIRGLEKEFTTAEWQKVYGAYCEKHSQPDAEGLYDSRMLGSHWTCRGLRGPFKLSDVHIDVVNERLAGADFVVGETGTQASAHQLLMFVKVDGKWLIDDWIEPGVDGGPGHSTAHGLKEAIVK